MQFILKFMSRIR